MMSGTVVLDARAGTKVRAAIYTSFGELEARQEEWDEFVESTGSDIFLTFDWCRIWWKYYGRNRDLRVFVFRRGGELVGLLPLFVEKIWLGPLPVKMIKFVGSDFTMSHFSPAIRSDSIPEVMRQLSTYLSNDRWSIMHVGPIAGLYAHAETLKDALRETFGRRHHLILEDREDQTYFQLYDSWDEYLKSLSRRQRQHIKEKYRRLRKMFGNDTPITSRFAEKDTFEPFFDAFVTAHQNRWEKGGRPGHFRDWPDAREFHLEVAREQLKHHRLRLLEVKAGQHLLGYKYAYKFADKYLEFLDARTEVEALLSVSLGHIIFCEQLKDATQERVRYIDSMRGKYDHKMRMGGKVFSMRNFYIIPKKPRILIPVMLFRCFACFLNLFYYRLWYNRAAVKLPLRRKGLWEIWIRTCDFAWRR